ncbi:MAG: hypothetical protein ACKPKO_00010, partial [Candidatus Fonsibacter sp.]
QHPHHRHRHGHHRASTSTTTYLMSSSSSSSSISAPINIEDLETIVAIVNTILALILHAARQPIAELQGCTFTSHAMVPADAASTIGMQYHRMQ